MSEMKQFIFRFNKEKEEERAIADYLESLPQGVKKYTVIKALEMYKASQDKIQVKPTNNYVAESPAAEEKPKKEKPKLEGF